MSEYSAPVSHRHALMALLRRLHFYVGLFIGPFIFVAALTGTLYVLTPQLENRLYADVLFSDSPGEAQPLSRQVAAAQAFYGTDKRIAAVRPAPTTGETTRVMFANPAFGPSETEAVFVDPVTLQVLGAMKAYGTSGILPFRTTLDYLHRSLLLGDLGRNYSELAASWLWVAALGGLVLWIGQRAPRARAGAAASRGQLRLRNRRRHTLLGGTLLIGLLFLSVTGLTWSNWAGNNIASLRQHFGWLTPQVNTALAPSTTPAAADPHAEHHHAMAGMPMSADKAQPVTAAQFDGVLHSARAAGISAGKVEIRPSYLANKAWTVSEIDRRWPTRVDAVSINGHTLQPVDKVEFAHFGLLAKLTRWGVDAHMGVLFGLANQLLLVLFGVGLCTLIALGYRLWWLRRPAVNSALSPLETLTGCWCRLGAPGKVFILLLAALLGWSLPLMGLSLLVFIAVDLLRWRQAQRQLQPA
ncbi:PepSY domain-containing protein [Pantoea sp. 1.19]|uniref:PepSY-associated TM helix domain-containing protein n=1 Tax=Pantoea sp. 1.19 TaxID=1925589 RepID=UPI000949090A|nr:PepSY domain-containing protein [Pantoea sp. 1.19]